MPAKLPSRSPQPVLRVIPEGAQAPSLKDILGDSVPRKTGIVRRISRWLIAAAAVLAAGILAWLTLGQGDSYSYTTQKAVTGDLTVVVTATGTMQPISKVDVSTPISGIVRKVNVDYNSVVRRDDVLAEIDMDTYKASLASARAKLAVANANVAKAKAAADAAVTTYERQSALFNRGVLSAQSLEDTRLTMDANAAALLAVEAEVLVAEADLQLAQTNLARATITSPIDGIVLTREIDEGATVAASLAAPVLFTIAGDLRQMEAQVDVDEADIGNVAVGQSATFTVDAYPDRSFPAEITDIRVVSETINDVVTYKALLKVDNAELLLRPGMTATADIVVETVGSALLVPNTALRYSPPEEDDGGGLLGLLRPPRMTALTTADLPGGSRSLWVMRDRVPIEVTVQTGATDGQNTVLTSGDVAEGDDLVVDAVAKK